MNTPPINIGQNEIVKVIIDDGIYNDVYLPFLSSNARTQIFFGGAGSGKSYFLAQRCIEDLMSGDRNYLIAREVAASLRTSTFNELKKCIEVFGFGEYFKINQAEMVFTCTLTKCQAILKGLDDVSKIQSVTPVKGVITDIWIEEATEMYRDEFKLLTKRLRGYSKKPKRLILSFNPVFKTHWIFKEFFVPIEWKDVDTQHVTKDLTIVKTTYKDNKFLTPDDKADLENETDEYYYKVFTLGEWGFLGSMVFSNFKIKDLGDMLSTAHNIKNGIDFGWTAPTAFVRCSYEPEKKRIYILREIYEKNLSNDVLSSLLLDICGRKERIYADSEDPRLIEELAGRKLNIIGVDKGHGSILTGIRWLQNCEIYIHYECKNTINEFTLLHWKKDITGGGVQPVVEGARHAIDGLRYAFESEMGRRVYGWA